MRTSPPYLMGCFRGALGLGVAHGKSLSKRCPEVVGSGEEGVEGGVSGMEGVSGGVSEGNLVVVNNWRSWSDDTGWSNHSAMHHTTQSMCNVASKVSLHVFKYLSLGDNFFFDPRHTLILLFFFFLTLSPSPPSLLSLLTTSPWQQLRAHKTESLVEMMSHQWCEESSV